MDKQNQQPVSLPRPVGFVVLLVGLAGVAAGSEDVATFVRALTLVMLVLGPVVAYLVAPKHILAQRARRPRE